MTFVSLNNDMKMTRSVLHTKRQNVYEQSNSFAPNLPLPPATTIRNLISMQTWTFFENSAESFSFGRGRIAVGWMTKVMKICEELIFEWAFIVVTISIKWYDYTKANLIDNFQQMMRRGENVRNISSRIFLIIL